jgi:L-lactate dehydrogenase complex protein LldG
MTEASDHRKPMIRPATPGHPARAEMLARIRTANGPSPTVPEVPREYRRAGAYAPGAPELLELFADRLVHYRASVHLTTVEGEAALAAQLLAAAGRIVVPPDLPAVWHAPHATVDSGLRVDELDDFDTVVTTCAAAAAETGTIVLDSGPGQGRRALSLLPHRHICLVDAGQVVAGVPELLARLDPRRPLTFISGPSATSDIELQRVEGVHGPHVLVVVLRTGPG